MANTTALPAFGRRRLTTEEVAERTGIPENTFRYWRHQKMGPPSHKIGRRVGYFEDEVDAWLAQQVASSTVGDQVDVPASAAPALTHVCPTCGHGHPGGR